MLENFKYWLDCFDETVKIRGAEIYDNDGVFDVVIGDSEFNFKVRGRSSKFYEIKILVNNLKIIDMSCGCYFSANCKHLYACLLYIKDHEEEIFNMLLQNKKTKDDNFSTYENILKQINEDDMKYDLNYLFENSEIARKYLTEKYVTVDSKDEVFKFVNKIIGVLDYYNDALTILENGEFDTCDKYEFDSRFVQSNEYYYDDEYYLNENYFFDKISALTDDLFIKINANKRSTVNKVIFEITNIYYDNDYFDCTHLLEHFYKKLLNEAIINFDKDETNKWIDILFKLKIKGKYYSFIIEEIFDNIKDNIEYRDLILSVDIGDFSEKYYLLKEQYIIKNQPTCLILFYQQNYNKIDYCQKLANHYLKNNNINQLINLSDNLINWDDKYRYVNQKILLYYILHGNEVECKKYAILSITKNNISKNYDIVKGDDLAKIEYLDKVKSSVDSDTLLKFYFNQSFYTKALKLAFDDFNLLVSNFEIIYKTNKILTLKVFENNIEKLVLIANKNPEYEHIYYIFKTAYIESEKSYFESMVKNIINHTKKRNLKSLLNQFILIINSK